MATAKQKVPDNMAIYDGHREPPKEAIKPIQAGRLRGMSDINPMWRIKALTEEFGPCGIGWYYTVDKQWLENCGNETVAFVNISLYFKQGDDWSKPIFGNGGSKLIAQEKNGAFVSDEAFKMALTDAIGVACKQLGIAADVYWNNDRSKYTVPEEDKNASQKNTTAGTTEQKPAEPSAEELAATPPENVDKRLNVAPDNKMTKEQYAYLLSEIKRTDAMKDVVAYAKTEDLTKLTSSKCVSILIGLNKRDTKKKA